MNRLQLIELIRKKFGFARIIGDEVKVNCPFCPKRVGKTDTKRHLGINVAKGVFGCFRCHAKNPDQGTLHELLGIDSRQHTFKPFPNRQPEVEGDILPAGFTTLSIPPKSHIAQQVYWYLRQRGIRDEAILISEVGYTLEPGKPNYRNRAIFPVRQGNKIVSFQARAIGEGTPKTLNPTKQGEESLSIVYGIDWYYKGSRVFVSEGPMDALSHPGGLALLGRMMNTEQKEKILLAGFHEIVVCLDGGLWDESVEIARKLARNHRRIRVGILPVDTDPADLKTTEFEQVIASAIPYQPSLILRRQPPAQGQ